MSRQYQDSSYHSGHYQTPHPTRPQQPGQSIQPGQPVPINRDDYSDHLSQHAYTSSSYQEGSLQSQPSGRRHSSRSPYAATVSFAEPGSSPGHPQTYPTHSQIAPIIRDNYGDHSSQHAYTSSSYQESSLQPQPSGRRHSSRSPYTATVPFPEPGSSPGHPQTYPTHSQIASNFSGDAHQQGLYLGSYPQSTSDSHRYSTPGGSNAGGGSTLYSQPGAYNTTQPPAYDWNAAGNGEERGFRPKGPGDKIPAKGKQVPPCRFPQCYRPAFMDRRINERREWCSDEHMQAAIVQHIEKPCKTCQVWPRRNGYKLCSGNYCRYPPHR